MSKSYNKVLLRIAFSLLSLRMASAVRAQTSQLQVRRRARGYIPTKYREINEH